MRSPAGRLPRWLHLCQGSAYPRWLALRAPTRRARAGTGGGAVAPTGPPLSRVGSGVEPTPEDQLGDSPEGEADPLVSNGLGSPACRSSLSGELGSAGRQNCETSGFVASAAPTGNYGIDVHIDTGVLGLSSGGLLSTVQDLVVSPLWMALVWIAHALIVMLEWGFSIDLLDSASAGALGSGLARAQANLTAPWLPFALAVAATLGAYHGLVRRRVAETLGELLLMGAMLAGGMWLILDPTGTVGALGRWANQAGLGTLAVAVQGSPTSPGRALGVGMGGVFRATIEGPWCYLEFGDVSWCREQSRLDPRLRSAALKIADQEIQGAGCAGQEIACASSDAGKQALQHSGRLLRQARTNGAIFLALPANGPARNSINDQGSLLQRDLRIRPGHQLQRAGSSRGGVPHRLRDLVPARGPDPDRGGSAREWRCCWAIWRCISCWRRFSASSIFCLRPAWRLRRPSGNLGETCFVAG